MIFSWSVGVKLEKTDKGRHEMEKNTLSSQLDDLRNRVSDEGRFSAAPPALRA